MKANVGGVDRIVRIVLGLVILALGYFYHSWWGLIGLLPLLTGLFRICCLYELVGVNTCKTKTETEK